MSQPAPKLSISIPPNITPRPCNTSRLQTPGPADVSQVRAWQPSDMGLAGKPSHKPASASVVLHGTGDGGSVRSNRLRTIYWIHFPKTSSLFATTVLTYACGADRVPLDRVQNLTTLGPGPQTSDCGGMLPRTQCCGHRHSSWFHDPLPWPAGGGLPKYSVVFLVRDPIQRALSAFGYLLKGLHPKCCFHGWGWEEGSATSSRRAKTAARLGNLSAFLAEPSAAGCQTKMLVGRGCMASKPPSKNETTRAVAFVRKHAAFVGLADADRYSSSVCLWHALFGGRPLPSERLASQLASQGRPHDVADARKLFVDRSDQALYAAAVRRFETEVHAHASDVAACEATLLMSRP